VRCEVDTARLDEVLRHLTAAGVRSLTSQPPTLEELFLRHYSGGSGAGDSGAGDSGTGSSGTGGTAAASDTAGARS
jgi:ABC-2 type transport system ATP-binding protein